MGNSTRTQERPTNFKQDLVLTKQEAQLAKAYAAQCTLDMDHMHHQGSKNTDNLHDMSLTFCELVDNLPNLSLQLRDTPAWASE